MAMAADMIAYVMKWLVEGNFLPHPQPHSQFAYNTVHKFTLRTAHHVHPVSCTLQTHCNCNMRTATTLQHAHCNTANKPRPV
jgi:hypothetical protein